MLIDLDMEDFKRLLELAREGFSRGWDGIDSQDRLQEIQQIEDRLTPAKCDFCPNAGSRCYCGVCAGRYGVP